MAQWLALSQQKKSACVLSDFLAHSKDMRGVTLSDDSKLAVGVNPNGCSPLQVVTYFLPLETTPS